MKFWDIQVTAKDKQHFAVIFAGGNELPLTEEVKAQAIELKQSKNMSLGDAIIAATCLVHHLLLVTRNTDDFKHIAALTLINPYETSPAT